MLLNFLRSGLSAPEEQKSSAVGKIVALQSTPRGSWSPRDSGSLIRLGYQSNTIVYRCVRMVAEAAAATGVIVSEGGRNLATHPILSLLSDPNGGQDGVGFLETIYAHLLLNGNAYLEASGFDERNAPSELHTLRPERMTVLPGADGWPMGYEYRVGNRKHVFDMTTESQPILHIRAFHPRDDHYGMAPLDAAASAIDIHNSAASWSKGLLDNAARPSGAIVYNSADGDTLSDEQFRRISSELEMSHQGARNAGRPMLLEGGLDWKPMGFSPSDMEFLKTKESASREIALAFGVPPQLLGLPGDNTYSNYQEANRAFYRQTVLPLTRRVSAAVATWLGWRWGTEISLKPDLDTISALQVERESQWRRVAEADFLDDDEKRALLGFAPRNAK